MVDRVREGFAPTPKGEIELPKVSHASEDLVRHLRDTPRQKALAVSGPILCNDVDLNPAPGRVAACVPFADRAEARLVPSSPEACAP